MSKVGGEDAATRSEPLARGEPAATESAGQGGAPLPEAPRAHAPAPAPAPRAVQRDIQAGATPGPRAPDLRGVDLDDEAEVERFVGGLSQGMIKAAGALRRRRPGDPLAYRLLRVAIWLRAAEPPARDGRTGLAGIAANDRARYEAMLRNQRWAPLLDEVESALARPAARFHLDLQRYALAALEGLGDGYVEARRAVLGELAGLLARMPGLVALRDREGTPLADEATRRLVEAEVRAPAASAAAAPPDVATPRAPALVGPPALAASLAAPPVAAPALAASLAAPPVAAPPVALPPLAAPTRSSEAPCPEGQDTLVAADSAARAQLAAGAREAAVAGLQAAVERLAGPRARFLGRVALARLCLDAGLTSVARGLYSDLEREAEARGLAAWEPALVAPVLEGRLRAGEAASDARERLFAALAALDPSAAARLALAAAAASTPADARGRR